MPPLKTPSDTSIEFFSPGPHDESFVRPPLPTPPPSDSGGQTPGRLREESNEPAQEGVVVSISTTFHLGASLLPYPPDLTFLTSDKVFFCAHSAQILSESTNGFNKLVPHKLTDHDSDGQGSSAAHAFSSGPAIRVPESSTVFNVLLHAVYGLSCAPYLPTIDTLVAAVDAFPAYGIDPKKHVAPLTPLYALLLAHAPLHPLAVYALAAKHELHDLAVPVSSHLLSHPLRTLPDDVLLRIGPLYTKRLIFLHLGRMEALKRLLVQPPHPHAPTPTCDFADQKRLTRAWALASAYLAWDARPDMTAGTLTEVLNPLADQIACEQCKTSLQERIKQLIIQWAMVKRTI